jgi:outer membrane protein
VAVPSSNSVTIRIHNIMKYIVSLGLMMAAFLFATPVSAQVMEARFGHIDTQSLLEAMPERTSIQTEIETAAAQFEQEIVRMQGELESKIGEYQQKAETWPAAIRAQKEQEITGDQQGLEQFYGTVQQELASMEASLLEPMIERARVAIEAVGAEEGFTYIFDTSSGATVYNGGEDVLPLVKAKLGL